MSLSLYIICAYSLGLLTAGTAMYFLLNKYIRFYENQQVHRYNEKIIESNTTNPSGGYLSDTELAYLYALRQQGNTNETTEDDDKLG